MKTIRHTFVLLLAAFFITSCADSHDKLMEDQLDWIEDMTEVINDVADGDMSSIDAAAKIKELGKEGDEFMKRKETLNKGLSPEDLVEMQKKYGKRTSEATMRFMNALRKLQKSGRSTKELSDAMQNMKMNN